MGLLAAGAGLAWQLLDVAGAAYDRIIYLALPHAALLVTLLFRHVRQEPPTRIDRLMIISLLCILWFGVVPLAPLA